MRVEISIKVDDSNYFRGELSGTGSELLDWIGGLVYTMQSNERKRDAERSQWAKEQAERESKRFQSESGTGTPTENPKL